MDNKMMISENGIKLVGFEAVEDKMTLVFYECGLAIVPGLHKQTINNYPMTVYRKGEVISIQDEQLLDILAYRKTPSIVEFIQTETGYVALTVE